MEQRKTDTGQNVEFQEREWTVQRVGWIGMGLIVIAAFIGLLGNSGALATNKIQAADGALEVKYNRIENHHGPGELTVKVAPEYAAGGEVRIWLDAEFAVRFGLDSVVPEPESVETEPDRMVFVFAAGDQSGPLTITFLHEHNGYWIEKGRVGIVDGPSVSFTQFVFP